MKGMKTIIVYSSKYGYTEDCVNSLAEKIDGEVSTFNIYTEKIPSIDEFDNIIIGGSIYMGQIQKKLKLYCMENKEKLLTKRMALFLCCGLSENFLTFVKKAFPEEIITKAVAVECLGGELRTEKMKFVDKKITGLMKKAAAKDAKLEAIQMPDNIIKLAEIINSQRK